MDNDIYKIHNLADIMIKKINNGDTEHRLFRLEYGVIISVSKQVVKDKLKPGQIWSEYPMMKCVRCIYERHKWWQFWKWHKLIGYDVMYIGEDTDEKEH